MSLKGIWKGERIFPGETNDEGRDIAVSFLLIINHYDLFGDLSGTLSYDPVESGIDESAEIIGTVNLNLIQFVQILQNLYYNQEGKQIGVARTPSPEVFFEGQFMEGDYILGDWVMNKTFRMVENKIISINEKSGKWWLKKIRD